MKLITLYFALTFAAGLGAANAIDVLDIHGWPLQPGVGYYVVPRSSPYEGPGLFLSSRSLKRICPQDVTLDGHPGYPVKFSNWASNATNVPESENLNIKVIEEQPHCPQPTYWRVDDPIKASQPLYVTTSVSKDSFRNFFQIKKYNKGYKFVFSPLVCSRDVGIFSDGHIQHLAITNLPYEVVFRKAGETMGSVMSII